MCGIIGYVGKKQALPIVMEGLKRLEYRGYDSSGVVVLNKGAEVVKTKGRIEDLREKLGDIQGTTAIGHCLPPDTLIQLADGSIKEIGKIKSGEKVLCLNTKSLKFVNGRAKVFKHKSPTSLLAVKTNSTLFKATKEHKMLVFKDGHITYKRAKELSMGDILIVPKRIDIKGGKLTFPEADTRRYYELPDSSVEKMKLVLKQRKLSKIEAARAIGISASYLGHILKNDRKCREDQLKKLSKFFQGYGLEKEAMPIDTSWGKFITLPRRSTPELMQIIGYFLGDGTAQPKSIRFKDMDKDLLEEYKKLIHQVFNVEGRIVSQNDTRAYLLEVNSTYLSRWFKENVVLGKQKLLEEMGRASLREIAAFLRGLFDAEGCVATQSKQIALKLADERIARTIQFLLLRFGILSSFSKAGRRIKGWLPVSGVVFSDWQSVKKFQESVGFSSALKSAKLSKLLKTLSKNRLNFSFKFFPFTKKEIYKRYNAFLKDSSVEIKKKLSPRDESFLTRRILEEIVDYQSKEKGNDLIKDISRFLNCDVVFQPIKQIKKVRSTFEFLYDLEVSPHSNFIANGVVSHNSRWATHGKPSDLNAHPLWDCKKEIFVVHNGIIENYKQLKEELIARGHKFISETDTEVLPHLIEENYKGNPSASSGQALEEAVRLSLQKIVGAYAIAVVCEKEPNKIVFARQSSPLLVALGEGENFIASDATAILGYAKQVIYLDDGEMGVITPDDFQVFTLENKEVKKSFHKIEWDIEQAEKSGYPHFMLKEIFEGPETIENAIRGRMILKDGMAKLGGLEPVIDKLKKIDRIVIVAMGTAFLAGKVGEYMLEEYAGIPVEVENASEFRYKKSIINKNDAVLAISQSGETADTLFAVKEAKRKGALTLGIVNVVGSSIAREVEAGVYNHAGPEIAVASTKAFISQLTILALLTVFLGRQRNMSLVTGKRILEELEKLPELCKKILEKKEDIKSLAEKYFAYKNFLYLGRKYNYPVACEGALKLKEISYIHAEGMPAGEIKHGPIAMIDKDFPSFVVALKDSVYEKNVSNIEEIKARDGKVIALATEGDDLSTDDVVFVPKTLEMLSPILSVIPLQLFAYYISVKKGLDVDKPRNLAKSVVVE